MKKTTTISLLLWTIFSCSAQTISHNHLQKASRFYDFDIIIEETPASNEPATKYLIMNFGSEIDSLDPDYVFQKNTLYEVCIGAKPYALKRIDLEAPSCTKRTLTNAQLDSVFILTKRFVDIPFTKNLTTEKIPDAPIPDDSSVKITFNLGFRGNQYVVYSSGSNSRYKTLLKYIIKIKSE